MYRGTKSPVCARLCECEGGAHAHIRVTIVLFDVMIFIEFGVKLQLFCTNNTIVYKGDL